ncbi:MAG: hypothetical protein BWY77_00253 [bacterium ADurb.Bin431]|nr:MAG: hypothetical protein BWY77_00253 [bacterium ADurb.Bin431]
MLAEEQLFAADDIDQDDARSKAEGGLDRIGQPRGYPRTDDEAVDHHLDIVLLVLVGMDLLVKLEDLAIEADAHIAVAARFFKDFAVLTLAAAHHRREDLDFGLGRQGQDLVDDLLDGLAFNLFSAVVAVGHPDAGEEQAQVVVDLGHGAYRRTGVAAGRALLDRDRRREPLDVINIRFFHQPEKLPGVGGEGLDVAALSLGIKGVEGEGGFAAPREAGDHDQPVARDFEIDILEIVFAGAANDDMLFFHRPAFP